MAAFRDEGKIWFATIRSAMDYWLKLERVKFEYYPGRRKVKVYNHNSDRIEGLSLVWLGGDPYVDGRRAKSRKVDDEVVFWFDIEAMSDVTLSDDPTLGVGDNGP